MLPKTSIFDVDPISTKHILHQKWVGRSFLDTMSQRSYLVEDPIKGMMRELEAYVLSDHLTDDYFTGTKQVSHPSTSWQMFKSEHSNAWWMKPVVKRYPVKNTVENVTVQVKVERYLHYPEANIAIESLGRPVVFEKTHQTNLRRTQ